MSHQSAASHNAGNELHILRCPVCNTCELNNFIKRPNGYIQWKSRGAGLYDPQRMNQDEPDKKVRIISAYEQIRTFKFSDAMDTFSGLAAKYGFGAEILWGYLQACYGIVYLKGYNETVPKPTFCCAVREKTEFIRHEKSRALMNLPLSREEKDLYLG